MSFIEKHQNELQYSQSDNISNIHCFTTRRGGVSEGYLASLNLGFHRGDMDENVVKNYCILAKALGFDPHKAVCSKQVHEDNVRTVTAEDWGKGVYADTDYSADALITDVPGTALFVYSADCCTMILEDPMHHAVGACHAGWRGTALGIAGKIVRRMAEVYDSNPADIRVAIGPCISKCCFETDADVPDAMRKALGEQAEPAITQQGLKYHVDLKLLNRAFLQNEGILSEHISVSPLCTACDPDLFWSHRKVGNQRGSLAAMIVCGGKDKCVE